MIFRSTNLAGAFVIELQEHTDERGFFARSWCSDEFKAHGLNPRLVQCNISFNKAKGTLRGMHYQGEPFAEAKLVRCTRGSLFDVAIDLRPASPTYGSVFSEVLSEDNRFAMYIPEGCAHGFQTLEDDTEIFYQMSEFYSPQHQTGVRYDDPAFRIRWPLANPIMNDRDRTLPRFTKS